MVKRTMKRLAGVLVALVSVAACDGMMDVEVAIHDACNQSVLASAEYMDVSIQSAARGEKYQEVWSLSEGGGALPQVAVFQDAVVSVLARSAMGAGVPGAPIGAGAVGVMDFALPNNPGGGVVVSVALGKTDTFMNTTDADDPKECTRLIAERYDHTATRLSDGRVFIAGGVRENASTTTYWQTTEIFNPASGAHVPAQPMAWVRRGHTATALSDGRVLLVGGLYYAPVDSGLPAEQTWQVAHPFDTQTNEFKAPISMQQQRAYHSATPLSDGRVLIIGGQFAGSALHTTEIFDPVSNTSEVGPTLAMGRSHHQAIRVASSTVAIVGGRGANGLLDTIEFVRAGERFSTVAQGRLTTPRFKSVATVVAGGTAILIAGGFSEAITHLEHGEGLDSIEVLQLNRDNLASSAMICQGRSLRLNRPRGAPGAIDTVNGFLLVGGVDAAGRFLDTAEMVEMSSPASCQVTRRETVGMLSQGRAAPRLTSLIGGDVLVTGGITRDNGAVVSVGQSEIYVTAR
jgi:hypothetical protein